MILKIDPLIGALWLQLDQRDALLDFCLFNLMAILIYLFGIHVTKPLKNNTCG